MVQVVGDTVGAIEHALWYDVARYFTFASRHADDFASTDTFSATVQTCYVYVDIR